MKALALLCVLLSGGSLLGAEEKPRPLTGPQKFLKLFETLRAAEAQPAAKRKPVSFALTEAEINEYLRYSLRTIPRPGLESMTVKLYPNNYVSTFTMVDFDEVERWRPGTIPLLLRLFLRGEQSIWIDFRLQVSNAKTTLSVEKAYFGSLRLPSLLVEIVIQIVAARQPEHYDTSNPLPLPFGLRNLRTETRMVMGNN